MRFELGIAYPLPKRLSQLYRNRYWHHSCSIWYSGNISPRAEQGGYTALHWAATKGHSAVVEALLAGGAATSAKDIVRANVVPNGIIGFKSFLFPCFTLIPEFIHFTLQSGNSALHRAAANGQLEVVKALLAGGASTLALDIVSRRSQSARQHAPLGMQV